MTGEQTSRLYCTDMQCRVLVFMWVSNDQGEHDRCPGCDTVGAVSVNTDKRRTSLTILR